MAQINVSNLSFGYEGSYDMVFENVSFRMDTDWKLGFIGRNGCGKTTFLKLLMGKYQYSGTISAPIAFDYFPFEVENMDEHTIYIVQKICLDCMEWQVEKELEMLEVAKNVLYRPFNTLSNGERTKVLLAALFLKENRFLLLDEPTNHLDRKAREVVARYLNRKKGFVLVSHDRAFLDQCVDHVLSINQTTIEVQSGNFSTWAKNKEQQDAYELEKNERLKKEVKRLKQTAQKNENWSEKVEKSKKGQKVGGLRPDRGYLGHKAAKMMKRAKTVEARAQKATEEKSKLLKNIEKAEQVKLSPLKYHSSRLAELNDVIIYYGDQAACNQVSFSVEQGERIALVGKNGSGKSSVLKLLCGEIATYSGEIFVANNIKISYVPQDTSFLSGRLDAMIETYGLDGTLIKTLLRKMNFSREQFEKNMESYSAGQKKKVLIAKSLSEQAHLYIWDEPLNYIDVLSRIQIEEMICACRLTMIFVEHDHAFIDKVATKTVELQWS